MSNISKIKVSGQIHDVMDATARKQLSSCVTEDKLPKKTSDLTNDSGFVTDEITDGLNTRLTTVQSQLSGLATELGGI